MGIKFISGTDNFGVPVSEKSESPNDGYYIANVMLVNDYLSFSRLPGAKQQIEDEPTPILGLGLRKAFMSAAKEWEAIKNHRIKIRSEISTLTELEKSMIENKAGAAVLGLAGMALAGPVGVFAAFAAKKKGEVVFAMELRNNCSDPLLDGKVIVLSATEKEFQTIKRISKAPSKSAKEYASPITSENNDANDSISSELERLSKLKDSGAISEEEFSAAKAKLLGL